MNQAAFAQALFQPALPCPPGLHTWNGSDPAARFNVYRNNVVVSLRDALGATFPVVQALVGTDFFQAMAQLFIQAHPPRSPVMAGYGSALPDFIAGFAPAASLPYLADVARLELARVRAYHAADAEPLPPQSLQAALADPQQLPQLRLRLHPSLQLLASPHAICDLWAAHQGLLQMAEIDPYRAQTALVVRNGWEVEVLEIPAASAACIQALQQGDSLLAAASVDPALDLPHTLALLIRQQLITHISTEA
ncbi:Putative DNA-binding domain-containing protein [Rhodoferax sp. OV413]|uniref:HvfC/BufC N-terminal domain-containing protein n=1 Tax=Rhodoferax sp. OV413 TaxID=1855285 RepID=UPI00088017A4|nr:DNA-binding domain-containing protein [Rhodoferax sp. OV413]SDP71538.1 Putative DNA-binding domain-containing protein [Rhodoferax sp. OV413]